MRLRTRSARAVVGVLACLFLPSFASAAEPPDQNDPCSTGGVNSCGTNGDGITARYRYGIRWFGDFHGAVANEAHTFCIDLRFWYPAARYRYEAREITGLRSRAGSAVSALNQQKMAFALWRYGRSTSDTQQAAVMLYVHSLMGDAAPGEVDPSAVSPAVAAQFAQIGSLNNAGAALLIYPSSKFRVAPCSSCPVPQGRTSFSPASPPGWKAALCSGRMIVVRLKSVNESPRSTGQRRAGPSTVPGHRKETRPTRFLLAADLLFSGQNAL